VNGWPVNSLHCADLPLRNYSLIVADAIKPKH